MLLVNLKTGETLEADEGQLREHGMADGYSDVEDVTPEQWVEALQRLQPQPEDESCDEVEEPQVEVSLHVVKQMQVSLLRRAFAQALEKNPSADRYQLRAIKRR